MKDYRKLFSNFWGYADQHTPDCWGCHNKKADEIHHLTGRGMGGDPKNKKNRISNLIPLCRSCHTRTETDKVFNEELKIILEEKINEKLLKKMYNIDEKMEKTNGHTKI